MSELEIAQFGNKILRKKTHQLDKKEITSASIQKLIKGMKDILIGKKLGIGLAAPQVGKNISLAVIAIRPSETRPKVKPYDLVIINPEITEKSGSKVEMWEGCVSSGSNGKANLFAKVPRYRQIKLKYYDESGKIHDRIFKGLKAQVIQHEVDHLKGILFVDKVKNTKSYMTYTEYLKMIRSKKVL